MFHWFKEAYTGHPKEVWALVILSFVNRVGTMVIPFLSVYLTTRLHFSLEDAGSLMAAFGVGSLTGAFLGGKLSDRFTPNTVIIGSLWIGGLFFITLQWATDFMAFLALIYLTAAFGEAYRPAMTAAIATYVPSHQTGRTMSLIRLAINLGMSASPLIGGFVAVSLGYEWLFWIDGTTCILAGTYFAFISQKWKKQEKNPVAPTNLPDESLPKKRPYQDTPYLIFLLITYLVGFTFIQWFNSVPIFIKSNWHFDERHIGILMAINGGLIVLIEMPLIHFIEKHGKMQPAMLVGLFFLGISIAPFLLFNSFALCILAAVLVSIGETLFLPLNNAVPVNFSPPNNRGEYIAWYWMTWSLIWITAPLVGLNFIATFGFHAFWLFLLGISAIGLVLSIVFGKKFIK